MPYVAHDDCGPELPAEGARESADRSQLHEESQGAEGTRFPLQPVESPDPASEPLRAKSSVLRDFAPVLGSSDGSSEELPPARQRVAELRARIRACEHEQRRLQAEYEVEVQHCADLRDALEEREREVASAKAPLLVQLREAQQALERADRLECGAFMRIEDNLARSARLLEHKGSKIRALEQRLHSVQQDCQKLRREGPPKDAVVEEALRAADREMGQLLSGVQRREQVIACLSTDLRNALEFMIAANVEAAGGPSPDLGTEEFLPRAVREHLGLSEHGSTHLQILDKKYELVMAELRPKERLH